MSASSSSHHPPRSGIAGVVLGVGLGGFADGIALHQLAQWHNMGSAVLRPDTMEAMKQNMVWDGLFHAATWLITLAGVWLLWRDARNGAVRRARIFAGQMLMGWAAFNLVEGVIDHHLLNLHHVRDLPEHVPLYDWVFLGVGGVLLGAIGWMMSRPPPPTRRRSRSRAEAGDPER
jgi:uncharacterized membrane protein